MREILFRAKAINRMPNKEYRSEYKNGDWVYGLLTRKYDERFKNLPAEFTNEYGVSGIEVDYKTIGQYTGLNDKNGKKIFEGDIVQYTYLDEYILRAVVKFGEYEQDGSGGEYPPKKCIGFYVEVINDDCLADCFDYKKTENILQVASECEIIGNIHNNPELLNDEGE